MVQVTKDTGWRHVSARKRRQLKVFRAMVIVLTVSKEMWGTPNGCLKGGSRKTVRHPFYLTKRKEGSGGG